MQWEEKSKEQPYQPQWAEAFVRKKIMHVYGLKEEDFTMGDEVACPFRTEIHALLNGQRFPERRALCIQSSQLSEAAIKKLDDTVASILERYGDGFEVREKVYTANVSQKHPQEFGEQNVRTALADAYINHISNAAQQSLLAIGLTEEDAISMHGLLIKMALVARYGGQEAPLGYVAPQPDPDNRPSPKKAIQQLASFWRVCGRHINKECYPSR